jgi:hypothetical protein
MVRMPIISVPFVHAFVCAAVAMWAKLTEIVMSMNARNRMGMVERQLTTQAQRPGAREATMATATRPPGSLQRMVRPHVSVLSHQ